VHAVTIHVCAGGGGERFARGWRWLRDLRVQHSAAGGRAAGGFAAGGRGMATGAVVRAGLLRRGQSTLPP
jgi:hypothetical protein